MAEPTIQEQIARSAKELNKILGQMKAGTQEGLTAFGDDFVAAMYDTLNSPGSGVWYSGNPNQSSAPGEAPAPQSEQYRDSWDFAVGEDEDGFYVDVGSPVDYGPALEFGTSKIDPRPHLRPLVDEKKDELSAMLVQYASGNGDDEEEPEYAGQEGVAKVQELIQDVLGGE